MTRRHWSRWGRFESWVFDHAELIGWLSVGLIFMVLVPWILWVISHVEQW